MTDKATFPVIDGLEIPTSIQRAARSSKYAWHELDVNQSKFIPSPNPEASQKSLWSSLATFRKRPENQARKFKVFIVRAETAQPALKELMEAQGHASGVVVTRTL